jgi:hypothetical protein
VFDYTNDANDYKIIVEEARREKYRERGSFFYQRCFVVSVVVCVCVAFLIYTHTFLYIYIYII